MKSQGGGSRLEQLLLSILYIYIYILYMYKVIIMMIPCTMHVTFGGFAASMFTIKSVSHVINKE